MLKKYLHEVSITPHETPRYGHGSGKSNINVILFASKVKYICKVENTFYARTHSSAGKIDAG